MKRVISRSIVLLTFLTISGLLICGKSSEAKERWDTEKAYLTLDDGFRLYTYLSENGKKAWVYKVESLNNSDVPNK